MNKLQEFFLAIGFIEKKEWGIIIIGSIITTPIGGIMLLIYFWIKAYRKYVKSS